MSDTNFRDTIEPRSDQLNYDDVAGTTKTITVTSVKRGTPDQPVTINYEGDNGRPYKPCKSMRRVLVWAWGEDGRAWAGRSMTLNGDPEVKFGGVKVGGIRISHLSHIDKTLELSLTVTKGKRAPYVVHPLKQADPPKTDEPPAKRRADELKAAIGRCKTVEELDGLKEASQSPRGALSMIKEASDKAHAYLIEQFDKRRAELEAGADEQQSTAPERV